MTITFHFWSGAQVTYYITWSSNTVTDTTS
ncbi:hypothetical protein [Micromonospora sp. NPDC049374]